MMGDVCSLVGPLVGETNCVAIRLVSSLPFLSVCSRRRQKLTKGKAGEGSVQSCGPLISVCLKVV